MESAELKSAAIDTVKTVVCRVSKAVLPDARSFDGPRQCASVRAARRMLRDFAMVAMTVAIWRPLPAQTVDEVDAFVVSGVLATSEVDQKNVQALWKKIQIGEKFDRLEARRQLAGYGKPLYEFLRTELLTDNQEDSRNAAMVFARRLDRSVGIDLRAVVEGKSKGSLRHAAMALGVLGGPADVDPLFRLARSTRRPEVKRAAYYALGRLASEKDAGRMADELEFESAQEVKAAALLALGRIGGPEALKAVAKYTTSHKESLRRAAVLAVADARLNDGFPHLVARLNDPDELVVRNAVLGLALIRRAEVVTEIEKHQLLTHRKDDIRAAAVAALGTQGTAAALDSLTRTTQTWNEREAIVRRSMAFAFARLGGMGERLMQLFQADTDADVTRAFVLSPRVAPQALPIGGSSALLDRRHPESVRQLGLLLFARFSPKQAIAWIQKALVENADKKEFLETAAELYGLLKRPEVAESLLDARIQVVIDDLGGDPEWNILAALHGEMLAIEHLDGPISPRGSGVTPGGSSEGGERPKVVRWNKEEEDFRLWYDLFPYYDRTVL